MSDNRPIGVLDSGIGGLTVVKELHRLMPQEKILYLGDTARAPYGARSESSIRTCSVQSALYLLSFDIKMLIIACNTISAVAIEQIREQVNEIPVIGVVMPGCKAAVTRTAVKKIGIIGTEATIQSNVYNKGISQLDPTLKVYGKACPLFVPLSEEGLINHEITHNVAQYYLYEMVDIGIDCLILACTHYPLLMEVIQDTVSSRIELLDSALWTGYEAQNILEALYSKTAQARNGLEQSQFMFTDTTRDLEKNAERFFGNKLSTIKIVCLENVTTIEAGK